MNKNTKASALIQIAASVISASVLFVSGYIAQSETSGYWITGSSAVLLFLSYSWLATRFGQAHKITMFLFLVAGVFAFTYGSAAFREVNELGSKPYKIAIQDIEQYIDKTPLYVEIIGILRNDLALHWAIKTFTPDASGASTYHEGYEHKCLTPFTGQGWNSEIPSQIITDICRPSWSKQSPQLKTIKGYLVRVDTQLPRTLRPYLYPQAPVNPLPTVETEPMQFKVGEQTLLLLGKRRPDNLIILGTILLGGWFITLLSTLLFITSRSSKQ